MVTVVTWSPVCGAMNWSISVWTVIQNIILRFFHKQSLFCALTMHRSLIYSVGFFVFFLLKFPCSVKLDERIKWGHYSNSLPLLGNQILFKPNMLWAPRISLVSSTEEKERGLNALKSSLRSADTHKSYGISTDLYYHYNSLQEAAGRHGRLLSISFISLLKPRTIFSSWAMRLALTCF